MRDVRLTKHEIDQIADFMRDASGNDFSDKGAIVNAKVSRLCMQEGYHHFYEFWEDLRKPGIAASRLRQQLLDELTTNYSYFYRESSHFTVLANLIAKSELPLGVSGLSAWSAGCATGEEAYNLAMTFEDAHRAGHLGVQYHVVGSDISSRAIEAANAARYDMANIARMPLHWRNLYCMHSGQHYDVRTALRKRVEFRRENVLAPRTCTPFDVVMCRNMIIYFDNAAIERFCSLLYGKVKPGGYLFLGHTELIDGIRGFTKVETSVWRRNLDAARII